MTRLVDWILRLLGVDDHPEYPRWADGSPRPKVWRDRGPLLTESEQWKALRK